MIHSGDCGILVVVLIIDTNAVQLEGLGVIHDMRLIPTMIRSLLLVAFCLLLLGCTPGEETNSTPTRSGEEVISTAKAYAELTRQATAQTPPPTPIPPSPTATPPTPTPEPTETLGPPIATAKYNANIRNGPDEAYDLIDVFFEGQTAEVIGRYNNLVSGTWWYIQRIGEGKDGWVWDEAVTLTGSVDGVPFRDAPPTPNP